MTDALLEVTREVIDTGKRRDTVGTPDAIACPACGFVGTAEATIRHCWHGPETAS